MTEVEMSLTNEQLVEQFQSGNESAFSRLVERLLPMLRREASLIRCNHADADDLAQEALCGLLNAARRFRFNDEATFTTYARVCVRNRLLNAGVSFSSPESPRDDEWLFDKIESDGVSEDPGDWLQRKEESVLLLENLKSRLSDLEYRVLMYHLAAYTYDEIGRALGVAPKSVDNALQRIRRKLVRSA